MALNTKTLPELEETLHSVAKAHHARVDVGIKNGHIRLEDGLPWIEIVGQFNKESAHQFLQDLADALNIRVLFNRLDHVPGDVDTIYGVLDLDPDAVVEGEPVPPYPKDEDAQEFLSDYGQPILPKVTFSKMKL